jgi:hypothetical protein
MNEQTWERAEIVARELANRETDINEVQKVAGYARTHPDGGRVFTLLRRMVTDGRYLVRTGRTLDYYRDIREVCERHLGDYRTATGEAGQELVEILGWTARLMRYYRTPEGEAELAERARTGSQGPAVPQDPQAERAYAPTGPRAQVDTLATETWSEDRSFPEEVEEPPRTFLRPPPPPARPETKRERVTLTTKAKAGKAQVKTEQGEEIPCTALPGFPPAEPGDECRADVTREGGKAIRAVFKGWS